MAACCGGPGRRRQGSRRGRGAGAGAGAGVAGVAGDGCGAGSSSSAAKGAEPLPGKGQGKGVCTCVRGRGGVVRPPRAAVAAAVAAAAREAVVAAADVGRPEASAFPSPPAFSWPLPPVPCDDVPSAPHWLGRNVYVRRLPPLWGCEMPSEIHVYNLFSRFGQIERLRILRDHASHAPLGSALVLFMDSRAASLAVQYINSGAIPGAAADFWLPRSLVNNTPASRRGTPATGWLSSGTPSPHPPSSPPHTPAEADHLSAPTSTHPLPGNGLAAAEPRGIATIRTAPRSPRPEPRRGEAAERQGAGIQYSQGEAKAAAAAAARGPDPDIPARPASSASSDSSDSSARSAFSRPVSAKPPSGLAGRFAAQPLRGPLAPRQLNQ
jgi:hypothetical protein